MHTLFRCAGSGGRKLLHKNLLAEHIGFGDPVQRGDGWCDTVESALCPHALRV